LIRALAAATAIAAATVSGVPAHADALDMFGFGARSTGMAGATTAAAVGVEAVHANPAGVALGPFATVMIGYGYGSMQLDINGRDARVLDARGTSLGLSIPVHFEDVSLGVGLALYLPDAFVARVQLIPATEPHFGLLDNDPLRIVVEPVAAIRIRDIVSIGAGVSLLSDAAGNGITFDVGAISGEKVGRAAIDMSLPLRAAPLVGVLVRPTPRTRAGITYRGELRLDLALDILANVDVAGVVTGDTLIALRASNYFTPRKLAAGVAVDVANDIALTADVQWNDWSAHPGLAPDLRVRVNLDTAPPLVQTPRPSPAFRDTIDVRAGAQWRGHTRGVEVAARAGYAFIPSPVRDQTGVTSIADNDRHVLALGAGATIPSWHPILVRPVTLDVALQWHHLRRRLTRKRVRDYPGDAFSSAGDILFVTTTMKVRF